MTTEKQSWSLASWRERIGWSQDQAARAMGVSTRTYIRYEQTQRYPTSVVWATKYLEEKAAKKETASDPLDAI